MASKVWFITGTSKGFGRVWAEAALERGDPVVATARDVVDARRARRALRRRRPGAAARRHRQGRRRRRRAGARVDRFGRLDVVVNNAGYGLFGAVEEVTEEQARAQLETNFFGALWVTQAVLPLLREQRSGHILQVSSIGGVHAFPVLGLYHASKWALEGLSQSLHAELEEFGVHVTLVEPGGFSTDWSGPSATRAESLAAYDGVRERRFARLRGVASRPGDPDATGAVILDLVDMEQPPLRLFLGDAPLELIKPEYAARLEEWERHADLAHRAQGTGATA